MMKLFRMHKDTKYHLLGGLVGGLALTSGLTAAAQATAPASSHVRSNILILYADDLGYGDLGSYNRNSKIPTPNLDRLAAEGLRLTDGHSSSGICTPSRYALLTGRAHWRDFHGIDGGFDRPFFKPGQLTMGEMLRSNGYHTAAIGKWHLGNDWDSIRKPGTPKDSLEHTDFDWTKPLRGGANDHGFDYYFGDNVINFPPYVWIENGRVLQVPDMTYSREDFGAIHGRPPEGNWECRPGPGRSDWDFYQVLPTLTEKAVEYIHSRKDKPEPFFLYFSLPAPHTPIVPNKAFQGSSEAGPYGDLVVETDDSCGQLLAALREAGLESNTIVIFSADNGSEYFAYARDLKFDHWSAEPLRGLKRDIYEGGHRVPTILKWPGVTEPGSVSDALFAQTDLMATLASYLGFDLPRDSAEDSYDFWPYLNGEVDKPPRTSMVHNTSPNQYAIRDGHWLLVDHGTGVVGGDRRQPPEAWLRKYEIPPYADQEALLFNLSEDIGQRYNLAKEQPDRVAEMQALLKEIRERGFTAPRLEKSPAMLR